MKKQSMRLAAAAMAGMFAGGVCYAAKTTAVKAKPAAGDTVKPGTTNTTVVTETKCEGMNACKGKGACKTSANACAGKNACKGKGVTMTKSAEECTGHGGKVVTM
jgi:hypothetical protein